MKQTGINISLAFLIILSLASCNNPITQYVSVDKFANIYPQSLNPSVPQSLNPSIPAIPPNIAPFNFEIRETGEQFRVRFSVAGRDSFEISSNKAVKIPVAQWKNLLGKNRGDTLEINIFAKNPAGWLKYKTVKLFIAEEPIDPYIAYRLIEPGYIVWNKMGLYQRNIENFDETPIMLNSLTDGNCMNCHSFCRNDPETMLFHIRKRYAGTVIVKDGKVDKVNIQTPDMPSAAVYPRWHPEGRYVAFSTNVTRQAFHSTNKNKIEVYDKESDIIIYDTQANTVFTDSLIHSPRNFETFPEWSPDGRYLYFCSAPALPMPQQYDSLRYSLLRISFDAQTGKFGNTVDTLVSAAQTGKSVAFPRVSPDGKYLVFCMSDYGTFPIWHRDNDLYMLDLGKKEIRNLTEINSNQTDSYHSWSSNGRWMIFSSRRLDGRYTRLFISYFDREGKMHAPFLLPQESPSYYDDLLLSYNVPEFIKGKIKISPDSFREVALKPAKALNNKN